MLKSFSIAAALASVAVLAGAPASAADLAVKAPVYKAPVIDTFTWQGFYVGGSLGASWAEVDGVTTGFGISLGGAAAVPAPPFPATARADYDSTTFRGAVHVGYNWLLTPNWLVGLEGDFGWGDGSKTNNFIPGVTAAGVATDWTSFSHKWDASIRARVGVLVNPDWLLYATGGVAWQKVEAALSCGAGSCPTINFGAFSIGNYSASATDTRTGWTLGAGIEGRIVGNWLLRGEYRYANYGTWDVVFAGNNIRTDMSFDIDTHTALIGLSYKFGGGPVVAKY